MTVNIKDIAYKDWAEYSKEETRARQKYWCALERDEPLLCHFLYNLDHLLMSFQCFVPHVYGVVFKKERRWNEKTREMEWVDK